jgi:two-component system, chemotaxis family, chemotaxis protein CheV
MAGVLDSVNQRTQMVGQNRLELLLFTLGGKQIYGINVFKVKEVLQCPPLTEIPKRQPVVRGVAHIRGTTISVMDLRMAIGGPPLPDLTDCFIIITEYNRTVQGFLVKSVERIINMNWGEIHPPPRGSGRDHYLTAVTNVDNQLVEIIDVEKILSEITPINETVSEDIIENLHMSAVDAQSKKVLIADDSAVARNQVKRTITQMGLEVVTVEDGLKAYEYLVECSKNGSVYDQVLLVISDIEMPEMDGYTLTAEIRGHSELRDLHVLLHTSLSGVFNKAMVQKVGADAFIAKFSPDELATEVKSLIDKQNSDANIE